MLGSIISTVGSLIGGERRNDAQSAAANLQMDFQREMSNTAWQRAVKDMRAAGINPILAYQQGGASTPGGAMPNLYDTVTPAIQTGLQAYTSASQVDKQTAEIDRISQEIENMKAGEKLTKEQTKQVAQLIAKLEEETQKVVAEKNLTRSKDYAQQLDNIRNSIATKFFQDNPHELIMREIGIGDSALKTILRGFGFVTDSLPDGPGKSGFFDSIISNEKARRAH